jgi:two-component system cell cycle response regulator
MSDDFLETTQEVTIATGRDELLKEVRSTGRAILIVLVGGRRGERAVLGDQKFTIGRGSTSDLQLESDAVSRVHAFIEKRGTAHYLVDNASTNGSYVNYQKAQVRALVDGDQIQIGESMFKYLSGDNIETAYHEEFRRLVRRDALTGALNRETFDEEMKKYLVHGTDVNIKPTLILFDLDHFKQVNDTYGHTAGDLVLSFVGERVSELVQPPHLFARVGGEEFAVIYLGEWKRAEVFAEELRQEIASLRIEYDHKEIAVTTSVGLSRDGATPEKLYETADRCLYAAKSQGRNRVVS